VGERFATRASVVSRAVGRRIATRGLAAAPRDPASILVAHHLLLGDTIMLTPLLAKLRANHPRARLAMTVPKAFMPLYAGRPYGVEALPYSPRDAGSARALFDEGPFDLAVVPGDNRQAWLAAALGARHIVAHAGDRPATKSWLVDDQRPYGGPGAWGDLVADLVEGREPEPFAKADWPAPPARPADEPRSPYAVLHVGASTPLKQWAPDRWASLAEALAERGLAVVWSAGPGEEDLVAQCDPVRRHPSVAGRLDLAQLWHLLAGATLLVSPDTGVAHLGRTTCTPTVTLFGPGSDVICGPGRFWRNTPGRAVTVDPFPCRDQTILFRRDLAWVRRCGRSTSECAEPKCMQAIGVQAVLAAVDGLLSPKP
jgi:ADP-heptose:LPS heptosyltransferase